MNEDRRLEIIQDKRIEYLEEHVLPHWHCKHCGSVMQYHNDTITSIIFICNYCGQSMITLDKVQLKKVIDWHLPPNFKTEE